MQQILALNGLDPNRSDFTPLAGDVGRDVQHSLVDFHELFKVSLKNYTQFQATLSNSIFSLDFSMQKGS
ncbi:hypothetical protein EB008_01600 [bacterium]|nr:hypothetical protein [bacterium]